jgi:hypothetical protein
MDLRRSAWFSSLSIASMKIDHFVAELTKVFWEEKPIVV